IVKKDSEFVVAGELTSSGNLEAIRAFLRLFEGEVESAGSVGFTSERFLLFEGSLSSSGVFSQSFQKTLAGQIFSSGLIVKEFEATITGAVDLAGSLSVIETLLRTFQGGVTPTGALTNDVGIA